MGSGRRRSRDYWAVYLAGHQASVFATGLPFDAIRSEGRLRRLLDEGVVSIAGTPIASLGSMDTQQWAAFEEFCHCFFNEFESYSPLEQFLAFKNELRRRGSSLLD